MPSKELRAELVARSLELAARSKHARAASADALLRSHELMDKCISDFGHATLGPAPVPPESRSEPRKKVTR